MHDVKVSSRSTNSSIPFWDSTFPLRERLSRERAVSGVCTGALCLSPDPHRDDTDMLVRYGSRAVDGGHDFLSRNKRDTSETSWGRIPRQPPDFRETQHQDNRLWEPTPSNFTVDLT